uniref:Tektin bundle interacting protein 1 n=1 Tax=Aquila chrysaetos chrysaetos TaxID=223781 RepID=A0A663F241_AQUCH
MAVPQFPWGGGGRAASRDLAVGECGSFSADLTGLVPPAGGECPAPSDPAAFKDGPTSGAQPCTPTHVFPPTPSDQYITLWGPRQAPLLKQAVRWKTTPIGWDAVGQSWSTGLNSRDEEVEDPWYALASGVAHRRWERAHAGRGDGDKELSLCSPPPAYAQHLREVAWWDPVVPAAYLGPCTRWGPFLWQERPVLGKEYGKSWGGLAGCRALGPPAVPPLTPFPSASQLSPAARAPGTGPPSACHPRWQGGLGTGGWWVPDPSQTLCASLCPPGSCPGSSCCFSG